MYVLGVSMSNHDRAACLLRNGEVVGAIAEERLDRRKKSEGFYNQNDKGIVIPPLASINYLLNANRLNINDIDLIVCGRSITNCREQFLKYYPVNPQCVVEPSHPSHHLAHAYSAYGTMPFDEAAVLVIDEQGSKLDNNTFEKCSWFDGANQQLRISKQFYGSGDSLSLGMFYDVISALLGLSEAGKPSAGKLMGLAAYGIDCRWPEFFSYELTGDVIISLQHLDQFLTGIGCPLQSKQMDVPLVSIDDLLSKYQILWRDTEIARNLAYYAQSQLEQAVLYIAKKLYEISGRKQLAYAGGVALNCIANSQLKQCGWDDVYVHPAATDDGNAVGLAYYGWLSVLKNKRKVQPTVFSPFTGKKYATLSIRSALQNYNLANVAEEVDSATVAAELLSKNEIVCWFQGKSEWGPRALGNRSILASPLKKDVKKQINSRIKFRESYRPLAVSGTRTGLGKVLNLSNQPDGLGLYMLSVAQVQDEKFKPLSHTDQTLRYQVVSQKLQPSYYQLIQKFGQLSGYEVLLNTSFNTLGEPIVESPDDAIRQFIVSNVNYLFLENHFVDTSKISKEHLAEIRLIAYKNMKIDPLKTALGLEAAGYPDVALSLLDTLKFSEKSAYRQGTNALRSYYALLFRIAMHYNDEEKAIHYAEQVIEWSAMPLDAYYAADFLAQRSEKHKRQRSLGQLIKSIAPAGGAKHFFSDLKLS